MYPIVLNNLKFVFAEMFSFQSKNEKDNGKMITGFLLTFVDEFNTNKIVLSAKSDFKEWTGKIVDVHATLNYREFGNSKVFKVSVNELAKPKS